MDVYDQIAARIIEAQETIIGPVAIEQALRVGDLQLDWDKHEVTISGQGPEVIDELVGQYDSLFGKVSVEVCKEAAARFLSELPVSGRPKSLA